MSSLLEQLTDQGFAIPERTPDYATVVHHDDRTPGAYMGQYHAAIWNPTPTEAGYSLAGKVQDGWLPDNNDFFGEETAPGTIFNPNVLFGESIGFWHNWNTALGPVLAHFGYGQDETDLPESYHFYGTALPALEGITQAGATLGVDFAYLTPYAEPLEYPPEVGYMALTQAQQLVALQGTAAAHDFIVHVPARLVAAPNDMPDIFSAAGRLNDLEDSKIRRSGLGALSVAMEKELESRTFVGQTARYIDAEPGEMNASLSYNALVFAYENLLGLSPAKALERAYATIEHAKNLLEQCTE